MFGDKGYFFPTSTTVTTVRPLDAISEVLSKYPQHATPTSYTTPTATVFNLRAKVHVEHIELAWKWVGSQATTLLSGDLYNFARHALYEEGTPYDSTTFAGQPYLTGVISGTNITDVNHVFVDDIVPLASEALNSATGYNVPACAAGIKRIPINRSFVFYSTSDTGANWKTEKDNLLFDFVSDSSAPPHPDINMVFRVRFRFANRG